MARARETYRPFRRNSVLHPEPIDGVKQKPGIWKGAPSKYFPPPQVRPNKRNRARLGEPRR